MRAGHCRFMAPLPPTLQRGHGRTAFRVYEEIWFGLPSLTVSAAVAVGPGYPGFTVEFKAHRTRFDANPTRTVVTTVRSNSAVMGPGPGLGDMIELWTGSAVSGPSARKSFKAMDAIQAERVGRMTVDCADKKLPVSTVAAGR